MQIIKNILLPNFAVLALALYFDGNICWLLLVYWWELIFIWFYFISKSFSISSLYTVKYLLPSVAASGFCILGYLIMAEMVGQCRVPVTQLWRWPLDLKLLLSVAPLAFRQNWEFMQVFFPMTGASVEDRVKKLSFLPAQVALWTMTAAMISCYLAKIAGIDRFAYIFFFGLKIVAEVLGYKMGVRDREPQLR